MQHVANGTNWATGRTGGSPIDFMALSSYGIGAPGKEGYAPAVIRENGALMSKWRESFSRPQHVRLELHEFGCLINKHWRHSSEPGAFGAAWTVANWQAALSSNISAAFHWGFENYDLHVDILDSNGWAMAMAEGATAGVVTAPVYVLSAEKTSEVLPPNTTVTAFALRSGSLCLQALAGTNCDGRPPHVCNICVGHHQHTLRGADCSSSAVAAFCANEPPPDSGDGSLWVFISALNSIKTNIAPLSLRLELDASFLPIAESNAAPANLTVQQWKMDAAASPFDAALAQLQKLNATKWSDDEVYGFSAMGTASGLESLRANKTAYQAMQAASLLPQKFEGLVTADATGTLSLDIESVLSPSALVLRIALQKSS